MRISDWSSDVCSSDLEEGRRAEERATDEFAQGVVDDRREQGVGVAVEDTRGDPWQRLGDAVAQQVVDFLHRAAQQAQQRLEGSRKSRAAQDVQAPKDQYRFVFGPDAGLGGPVESRSEEHTSELQSLLRISYAVFCLKKKNHHI